MASDAARTAPEVEHLVVHVLAVLRTGGPGVVLLLAVCVAGGAALALLMGVMRRLLRTAIDDRAELDEVI